MCSLAGAKPGGRGGGVEGGRGARCVVCQLIDIVIVGYTPTTGHTPTAGHTPTHAWSPLG